MPSVVMSGDAVLCPRVTARRPTPRRLWPVLVIAARMLLHARPALHASRIGTAAAITLTAIRPLRASCGVASLTAFRPPPPASPVSRVRHLRTFGRLVPRRGRGVSSATLRLPRRLVACRRTVTGGAASRDVGHVLRRALRYRTSPAPCGIRPRGHRAPVAHMMCAMRGLSVLPRVIVAPKALPRRAAVVTPRLVAGIRFQIVEVVVEIVDVRVPWHAAALRR